MLNIPFQIVIEEIHVRIDKDLMSMPEPKSGRKDSGILLLSPDISYHRIKTTINDDEEPAEHLGRQTCLGHLSGSF